MTLIFIYKSTCITWLSFMFPLLSTFDVWFVTSQVAPFYNEVKAVSRENVPMKLKAPDDLLSK